MAIIGTLPNNIQNGQQMDAVPVMNDFNFIATQVNANAAPLDSPALINSPTAPTPPAGDATTKLATTGFVTPLVQASSSIVAVAAGTADALTGVFTPAVAGLVNGMSFLVRAATANLTTTPTFKADGTAALPIVREGNRSLLPGDIAGAGHWLELTYDSVLNRYILANPAKVQGSNTNDTAAASEVGEYIASEVLQGSAIPLTSNVAGNITAITITPGDWDVFGHIGFIPAASTSMTFMIGSSSVTSATHDDPARQFRNIVAAVVPGSQLTFPLPQARISVAVNTGVFLVCTAVFTVSTCGGFGRVAARRRR